ncbi:hypothetical protein P9112_011627 [Eukaryota sp. TZLM1-RC]
MVHLALLLDYEGEGCQSLHYHSEVWTFVIKCSNCGQVHDSPVEVDITREEQVPGSRGSANFILKCRGCSRTSSISHVGSQIKNKDKLDEICTKNKFDPAELNGVFECRGFDIEEWLLGPGFICTSESDQQLHADLTEGMWADVDETGTSCFIEQPEVSIVKAKL